MGKTSLIKHIFEQEELRSQKIVYLDFNSVDRENIQNTGKSLRWLFVMVSVQLNLEIKLAYYWDRNTANHSNKCTDYFANCILNEIKDGVILALDNIDCLFCCRKVSEAGLFHSDYNQPRNEFGERF